MINAFLTFDHLYRKKYNTYSKFTYLDAVKVKQKKYLDRKPDQTLNRVQQTNRKIAGSWFNLNIPKFYRKNIRSDKLNFHQFKTALNLNKVFR